MHLDLLVNGVGYGTRLFLNNGKGRFREATDEWGLRSGSGAMSFALADVDGDGFLDLYVANYRATTMRDELEARFKAAVTNGHYELLEVNGRSVKEPDLTGRYTFDPGTGILENGEADVLYLNHRGEGFVPVSWTGGAFRDEDGKPVQVPFDWGLSVMFRDINGDDAPDIYVCNDFQSPDRIWINDGQGNFRAIPRLALRQTSLFSMGVDFADVDRDGHDDIFVADMLSRTHASRLVQLMDRRPMELPLGQVDNRPQYSRNTLFWNRGDGTYAEVAQSAGVEASEWTWCPVFLDVDLDGYEDLLAVTGHLRDAQNIDISRRIEAIRRQSRMTRIKQLELRRMFLPLVVRNFAFRNRGDLTFEDKGRDWGFDSVAVSQGIGLADLDNDGDLDVVVNCLNDEPLILRNDSSKARLAVRLHGAGANTRGIGARIRVRQVGLFDQSQEMICGGRYLSSDDHLRTFAVADAAADMAVEVRWRNGDTTIIPHARGNRVYEVDQTRASPRKPKFEKQAPLFVDVSDLINHRYVEAGFDDYQRQPLLPHKLSQLGPGVTWFDCDGDGWEDLVLPSGKRGRLALFRNDGKGGFTRSTGGALDTVVEHDQTTVLGTSAEGGRRFLIAGSAHYEAGRTNEPIARTYDMGSKSSVDFPSTQTASTGPLALGDADGDGNLELFIGGRAVGGRFPEPADSFLYRSRSGHYEMDQAASRALKQVGLVSAATWSDLDGDGLAELVLACELGPIKVFKLRNGEFQELTDSLGLHRYVGLWTSVAAGDFDGDGRMDLAAGNWGRNTKYQAHIGHPLHFYFGDPDGEGSVTIIEAYYDESLKKTVPFRDLENLSSALPFIREKYKSFTEFSTASVAEFMGARMQKLKDIEVNVLESTVFLNRGGHFETRLMPGEAQFAPVFGIVVGDLDGDGAEDLVLAQNLFEVPPLTSRLDGGRGVWLKGDGHGGFSPVPGQQSGIQVYGDGRGAALCDYDHDGRPDLAIAQNANATKLYRNEKGRPGIRVQLRGGSGNPEAAGAQLRLAYRGGRFGPVREIHLGGGYWSQDSSVQVLGAAAAVESIVVKWPGSRTTTNSVPEGTREICITEDGHTDKIR